MLKLKIIILLSKIEDRELDQNIKHVSKLVINQVTILYWQIPE